MRVFIILFIVIIALGVFLFVFNKSRQANKLISDSDNKSVLADSTITDNKNNSNPKSSVIIGGDVMLARWVEQKTLSAGGWTALFDKIRDTLKTPDCAIVNLESPIKGKKPQTKINSLIFAAKPESVEALTDAGIDAVTVANNHITDQGVEGFNETKTILDEKKIIYVGAADTPEKASEGKTISCGSMKVGLIGAAYGTNFPAEGVAAAALEDIIPTIKNLKTTANYVIVFPHWGTEYNATPSPYQKELAHKYIDAGADLVVGSHPHVLQPVEIYKNKTIAYSLGNLVFDQASAGKKTEGALLKLDVDDKTQNFSVIPIQIESYFRPALTEGDNNSYKESLGLKDLSWSLAR